MNKKNHKSCWRNLENAVHIDSFYLILWIWTS